MLIKVTGYLDTDAYTAFMSGGQSLPPLDDLEFELVRES